MPRKPRPRDAVITSCWSCGAWLHTRVHRYCPTCKAGVKK